MATSRCNECRQFLGDSGLTMFMGDPENAVGHFASTSTSTHYLHTKASQTNSGFLQL